MNDKLADEIERALGERGDWEKRVYATASLAGDTWHQIIAALRRSQPEGMVMVTEFMKPIMKYALGSGNGELLALLQKEYDGLLSAAEGRKW